MKHLKIYEEKAWNYDIGSYVVINPKWKEKYADFLEKHFGEVIAMYYMGWYKIKFILPKNVTDEELKISRNLEKRDFNGVEIEFKSKKKKEAEKYLKIKQDSKKYNL